MPYTRLSNYSCKDPLTAGTMQCESKLKVAPEATFTSLSLHLPGEASLGLVVGDPTDTGKGEERSWVYPLPLSPSTQCYA